MKIFSFVKPDKGENGAVSNMYLNETAIGSGKIKG